MGLIDDVDEHTRPVSFGLAAACAEHLGNVLAEASFDHDLVFGRRLRLSRCVHVPASMNQSRTPFGGRPENHPDERRVESARDLEQNARFMGDLGSLTLPALGLALSPLPLLLAVALVGPGGVTQRAVAFVGGEALAVAVVTAVAVFLLPVGDGHNGALGSSLAALELTIGGVLALLLVVHLRSARAGRASHWSELLDRLGPKGAFGSGLAMVVANPKNVALSLAGAAAILERTSSGGGELVGVTVFTLLGVSALVALLVLVGAFPARTGRLLRRLQAFLVEHERALVTVLLGVLATYFVSRGLLDTRS